MTTRGILSGLPGTTKYTPRLIAVNGNSEREVVPGIPMTNSLPGAIARGEYIISDGWCTGHAEFEFGSSAPAVPAGNVEITLPVAPWGLASNGQVGDYFLGSAMIGQLLGANDTPMSAYLTPALRAGFVVGGVSLGGAASVAIGASTVAVTHGFGVAPNSVVLTSTAAIDTVGGNVGTKGLFVTAIGASTFTINAGTTNLTTALSVQWLAVLKSSILTTTSPFALGSLQDHIEFTFAYPVAS